MIRFWRIAALAGCILLTGLRVFSLGRGDDGAVLSVHAAPGLRVYLDTVLVGRAPIDSLPIAPGTMVLRVLSADATSWSQPILAETLLVRPGDRVTRDIPFPGIRQITSEPYGALVFLGDSLVGTTPALLPGATGAGTLRLSLAGYEDASVLLSGDQNIVHVTADGDRCRRGRRRAVAVAEDAKVADRQLR